MSSCSVGIFGRHDAWQKDEERNFGNSILTPGIEAALYVIEHDGKHLDVDTRTQWRQEKAQPLLDSMHDWLRQTPIRVADNASVAEAMALGQPLDNNPVENMIRPIAIGRLNGLCTGSARAGKRAAAMQTLLGTAKLNGLDPAAWFAHLEDSFLNVDRRSRKLLCIATGCLRCIMNSKDKTLG